MPLVIKPAAIHIKDDNGNYYPQNIVAEKTTEEYVTKVTQEGTKQVTAVNSAGSAQVSAVQNKGDTVLASIPSDYTSLQNDVDSLREDINNTNDAVLDVLGTSILKQKSTTKITGSYVNAYLFDHLMLKNGVSYSFAITLAEAQSSVVYITLANHEGTNLKTSNIQSGKTSASFTYTPSQDNAESVLFVTGNANTVGAEVSCSISSNEENNIEKNKNAINKINSVVDELNASQINNSVHKNFIGRNVGEKYPIDIKKGEKYTVSTANGQNFPVSFKIYYHDANGNVINYNSIPAEVNQYTITLTYENVKFVRLGNSPQTVIQLEIGDTKTSFEPYYKDVYECNNIMWAKDISRKGYFVIDKSEMVNGTRDEENYRDYAERCHSRDIYIPAHNGDRIVASATNQKVLVGVISNPNSIGSPLFTSGWQDSIDMINEQEGYYCFLSQSTAETFSGSFKVIPNIYTDTQSDEIFTQEITDTIDAVRECQTEPSITFLLCTDIHYGKAQNGNPFLLDKSVVNMKAVLDHVRTDFTVCLGDITEGDTVNTKTYAIKANNALRNLGIPYLLAIGNHDDNRYISGSTFTASDMYSYYDSFVYNKVKFNENTNGRDYYIDCDIYKTRFVIIDSNTLGAYGFSNDTVTWFRDEALDTPNDYLVVVLVHESSIPSQNCNNMSLANGDEITNAITGYLESGKPIIQFYGHSHCDVAFTTPFLSIGTNCLKYENTISDSTILPSGAVKQSRAIGTISEDCWDVVVLRPLSRKVDCIRFGAGVDRSFTY